MASPSTQTQPGQLSPPWAPLRIPEACNYHRQEPAVVMYAGTPLCEACARRMAGTDVPFWR